MPFGETEIALVFLAVIPTFRSKSDYQITRARMDAEQY
jgi:hypothetical protein